MILDIIAYPDRKLKDISKKVQTFSSELHFLLDDMYDTMLASNGIGLAAIQVARPIRALIINLPDDEGQQHKDQLLEMINPRISHAEGSTMYQEGCLSVPGFYEDIERHELVTVTYHDRHGKTCTLDANELLSVAIQHEMDHLDGKLFIEKLPYGRRKKFEKEYKKSQRSKKSA